MLEKDGNILISTTQAMELLGITSQAAMSKKTRGIRKEKRGRQTYYYKSDIDVLLTIKERKAKDPQIALTNEREISTNSLSPTEIKAHSELCTSLRIALVEAGLGLEFIDDSLISAYAYNQVLLARIGTDLQAGYISYDADGNEQVAAHFRAYDMALKNQLALAKALGIGAGNRKGLGAMAKTAYDEMSELLGG